MALEGRKLSKLTNTNQSINSSHTHIASLPAEMYAPDVVMFRSDGVVSSDDTLARNRSIASSIRKLDSYPMDYTSSSQEHKRRLRNCVSG